jgi:hypothetical protein
MYRWHNVLELPTVPQNLNEETIEQKIKLICYSHEMSNRDQLLHFWKIGLLAEHGMSLPKGSQTARKRGQPL